MEAAEEQPLDPANEPPQNSSVGKEANTISQIPNFGKLVSIGEERSDFDLQKYIDNLEAEVERQKLVIDSQAKQLEDGAKRLADMEARKQEQMRLRDKYMTAFAEYLFY